MSDAAHSCAHIFWTPRKVNRTKKDGATPRDINSVKMNSRLSYQIQSFNSTSVSPSGFRNQEVISPSHPSIAKRGRNVEPFDTPINGPLAINIHYSSYFRRVIVLEAVSGEVSDVNAREKMNFASNSVLGKTPKFVDFGLSPAHTADKLNSIFAPAIRSGGLTDNSD